MPEEGGGGRSPSNANSSKIYARSFGLFGSSSTFLVAYLQSTLLLLLAILPLLQGQQQRPKEIDESYQRLIPFLEVPLGCDSTDNGYGIVDGQLEKCEVFLKEDKQMPDNAEDDNYEKYKCKHLRVNAKYNSVSNCASASTTGKDLSAMSKAVLNLIKKHTHRTYSNRRPVSIEGHFLRGVEK
uniref:Uncharacterized protein n=1 Tax=Ditylenchus dipsaci TaxID=166011 RepID=A0A915CZ10_9BILA